MNIVDLIEDELKRRLEPFMMDYIKPSDELAFGCSTRHDVIEKILKTLMAKKLVKMRAVSGDWTNPLWQFTPKGLQYIAELQSIEC